jgi:four helix bundle protein
MFNFEKLEVWHKAIVLGDAVYTATRIFPMEERFGLTNQMRRSAVSVSSNIAEGSSRSSSIDFGRFIEIATGSVFELVSQSFIARRQGFLAEEAFRAIYDDGAEIGRMLSGLRKSIEER